MSPTQSLIRRPGGTLHLGAAVRSKLQIFESTLNVDAVAAGRFGPRVIGYGEVTTVLAFTDPDLEGYAYKRMALFESVKELEHVAELYAHYNGLLRAHGINTPAYGSVPLRGFHGKPVLYLVQELQPEGSLANELIHRVPEADARHLLARILEVEHAVYARRDAGGMQVGVDGQMSNYAVSGTDAESTELPAELHLVYLDTSTAMLRRNGRDLLDIELFLRVMPAFLRGIVRHFFLQATIDKYYDFRSIVLDLIANLYKEQCPHLVAPLVEEANAFFQLHCAGLAPLSVAEAQAYYRGDAMTWELVSRLRNLEHWLTARVLRRPYPHIRPGPVQR